MIKEEAGLPQDSPGLPEEINSSPPRVRNAQRTRLLIQMAFLVALGVILKPNPAQSEPPPDTAGAFGGLAGKRSGRPESLETSPDVVKNKCQIYQGPDGNQRWKLLEGPCKDGYVQGFGRARNTLGWGSYYEGEYNRGMRHGKGTLVKGTEEDDRREKRKSSDLPDFLDFPRSKDDTSINAFTGEKYVGEWKKDQRDGQGTNTWPDGTQYIGEWKNDKQHGRGTYTSSRGFQYEGEWRDDNFEGQGTIIFSDGRKYVGQWQNDKQHGKGACTWPDGQKYEGEWSYGKIYGQGTMIYANGDKYIGQWSEGKRWGQGTLFRADGTKYAGEWREDRTLDEIKKEQADAQAQAEAERKRAEAQVRAEAKAAAERERKAKMEAEAQARAEARRKAREAKAQAALERARYRYGIYQGPNTDAGWVLKKGRQKHGFVEGYAEARRQDGAAYAGNYVRGMRHGQGALTWTDGRRFSGEWQDDQWHGQGSYRRPDGFVVRVTVQGDHLLEGSLEDFDHPKYRTPNAMYVYAGKLEAEGKMFEAKVVYNHIIENFSTNPIAIKASNRLRQILDNEKAEARTAAERNQRAAEAAAEQRRREAEQAERRRREEAEAAERQRQAEAQAEANRQAIEAWRANCRATCLTGFNACNERREGKRNPIAEGLFGADTTGCRTEFQDCLRGSGCE